MLKSPRRAIYCTSRRMQAPFFIHRISSFEILTLQILTCPLKKRTLKDRITVFYSECKKIVVGRNKFPWKFLQTNSQIFLCTNSVNEKSAKLLKILMRHNIQAKPVYQISIVSRYSGITTFQPSSASIFFRSSSLAFGSP